MKTTIKEAKRFVVITLRSAWDEGADVVSEDEMYREMAEMGFDRDTTKAAIDGLHGDNVIRWVAFRGWALGGRPS